MKKTGVRLAGAAGFDLVRKTFYSPIPDLREIDPKVWDARSSTGGVEFDSLTQIEHLERNLAPFVSELRPENFPAVGPVFSAANRQFGPVDASLLYAMLRYAKPKRVLEFGAGFSTLVSSAACSANDEEGFPVEFISSDPYPPGFLSASIKGLTDLRKRKLTDVSVDDFLELDVNDVLFVDTTHTVKLGGDVNYVILEALPQLRAGVLVHFHDIFLPWEYPRVWFERDANYWAEQYLLQAFLCFNREYEIVLAAHFLAREYPERFARAIPSFTPEVRPGSFWLRRRSD